MLGSGKPTSTIVRFPSGFERTPSIVARHAGHVANRREMQYSLVRDPAVLYCIAFNDLTVLVRLGGKANKIQGLLFRFGGFLLTTGD